MLEINKQKYLADDKVALLIRHADRNEIPKGEFGNEILLNETGKERALKFGEKLNIFKINKILTSPIARCVQTAEHIVKGYGKEVVIEKTDALGAPGLHISDEVVAGKFLIEFGFDALYRRIINGIPVPGISNTEQFNKQMTDFLNQNTTEKGITLFVTHDLLIAFYHYSINRKIYTLDNWVQYLGGLILKNGNYDLQ